MYRKPANIVAFKNMKYTVKTYKYCDQNIFCANKIKLKLYNEYNIIAIIK